MVNVLTVGKKLQRVTIQTEEKLRVLEDTNNAVQELIVDIEEIDGAILLARKCLETVLEHKGAVEKIISEGLSEVFDIKYTFILSPIYDDAGVLKGLKPLVSNGCGEADDPLDSEGTGANAITSVCLKIAILLLSKKTAKFLSFDEPFANLSPALQARFKAFIETICLKTGLQITLITHMDQPFGRVWLATKSMKGGKEKSSIEEIKND